jgi:hypothetical protein
VPAPETARRASIWRSRVWRASIFTGRLCAHKEVLHSLRCDLCFVARARRTEASCRRNYRRNFRRIPPCRTDDRKNLSVYRYSSVCQIRFIHASQMFVFTQFPADAAHSRLPVCAFGSNCERPADFCNGPRRLARVGSALPAAIADSALPASHHGKVVSDELQERYVVSQHRWFQTERYLRDAPLVVAVAAALAPTSAGVPAEGSA